MFTLVLLLPMEQEHLHLAMVHSLYSSLSHLDSTNGCSCCWMANDNPSLHHAVFGLSNISVCSQRLEPLQVHLVLVTNLQIHNIS
ncbi:hypothetical protein ZEAMMB73_Zm00001d007805 [Zea mays]|uniref:Uncharacterized protein n=1 Tax=Zea mays TaxID=4577 RepID=A0A1D6F8X7_MAIZE|nr:hypothetical protein ZEAMMB73_Zm00001d007805 [Zea mays]ONM27610.1 hypothetical protein ZEAMMB73_Zm00001d007805 [Zea mays]ONM27611.1 hypothetical protein ZEAMMB73_Zm00001d007805 [Zea mays]